MTEPPLLPGPPPPGWYHDGATLRWWSGVGWGPYAVPGPAAWAPVDPVAAGTTMSVLSHVGFFVLAGILPLVIRQTEGKKNDFVRHHSTEALNFHLTFLVVWISGFIVFIGAVVVSSSADDAWSGWVFLPFAAMFAAFGAGAGVSILGAIRAGQGRWWRYPVSIRFVRGAKRRSEI